MAQTSFREAPEPGLSPIFFLSEVPTAVESKMPAIDQPPENRAPDPAFKERFRETHPETPHFLEGEIDRHLPWRAQIAYARDLATHHARIHSGRFSGAYYLLGDTCQAFAGFFSSPFLLGAAAVGGVASVSQVLFADEASLKQRAEGEIDPQDAKVPLLSKAWKPRQYNSEFVGLWNAFQSGLICFSGFVHPTLNQLAKAFEYLQDGAVQKAGQVLSSMANPDQIASLVTGSGLAMVAGWALILGVAQKDSRDLPKLSPVFHQVAHGSKSALSKALDAIKRSPEILKDTFQHVKQSVQKNPNRAGALIVDFGVGLFLADVAYRAYHGQFVPDDWYRIACGALHLFAGHCLGHTNRRMKAAPLQQAPAVP